MIFNKVHPQSWSRRKFFIGSVLFVVIISVHLYSSKEVENGTFSVGHETKNTSPDTSLQSEGNIITGSGKKSKYQLYKCVDDESEASKNRWSDRPFSTSEIDSLFNCDLPDALCNYYYPANFFDKDCGLGKEFAHYLDDAEAMKQNNTLWNFMPSVGFPTITLDSTCVDTETKELSTNKVENAAAVNSAVLTNIGQVNEDKKHCMTERLSFLHVHKAGGSSLHNAFNFIGSTKSNANIDRHKFFTPTRGPGNRKSNANIARRSKDENRTLSALAKASKYPDKEFSSGQHVIFAAVRDPTERFISSIGQALGAHGSQGNHIGPVLKKECIKETSSATLKCLAQYVKDHGFWIELHFTPQVIDMSFTTMYQDVPISLFSFKHLKVILEYFGRGNVQVRNGSSKNYRSDPILTNMTVADYDEESLRIVCEIYEMDVRMQRSLGIEVPRCDPFIPQSYDFEK